MNFEYSNIEILSPVEKNEVLQLMDEKSKQLDQYFVIHPQSAIVKIHFSEVKNDRISVSMTINMPDKLIYVKDSGSDVIKTVNRGFEELKNKIISQQRNIRKETISQRKKKVSDAIIDYAAQIDEIRTEKDILSFNKLLEALLPGLEAYISRRIFIAEQTVNIHKGEFNAKDIIDELYLNLYNHFDTKPEDMDVISWIYQKADEVFKEKLKEEINANEEFIDLDEYVDKEYESMRENYGVNTEGKMMPYEELEGMRTDKTIEMYGIDEVLTGVVDDEQINSIYASINRKEIDQVIKREMSKMPPSKHNIVDLFLLEQMSRQEIATIKKLPLETVNKDINEGLKQIREEILKII